MVAACNFPGVLPNHIAQMGTPIWLRSDKLNVRIAIPPVVDTTNLNLDNFRFTLPGHRGRESSKDTSSTEGHVLGLEFRLYQTTTNQFNFFCKLHRMLIVGSILPAGSSDITEILSNCNTLLELCSFKFNKRYRQ